MTTASKKNMELFARLAEGNESAFRELFDAYRLPFFSAAFKLTHSAVIAEDIVQDVFIRLWEKREQVANARNPVAYLVAILQNRISFRLKEIILERQAVWKAKEALPDAENPVEELLLAKEHREILDAIISKMPPQQQLVYRLAKQEELSREEIAQKLNISANTVRNHLASASEFIRKYFQKNSSSLIISVIWSQL